MLRSLLEAFTSSSSSSSAACAAASSSKPADKITSRSNEERLSDIGFKNCCPRLFEDPINITIMDNPVILNNCAAQTLCKSTFVQCRQDDFPNSFRNPFNRSIDYLGILHAQSQEEAAKLIESGRAVYIENHNLKRQIDRYVENLEYLHYLTNQLNQLLCPIDDIASLFENTSALLVDSVIKEQKIERIDTICRTKSTIIELVMEYIRNVEAAIDNDEDTPAKKINDKKALLLGPTHLKNLLIAELELLAKTEPELQYKCAIEKVDYYHDLIFIPLTTNLENKVTKRIAQLSSLTTAIDNAITRIEPVINPSDVDLSADPTDIVPVAAPAIAASAASSPANPAQQAPAITTFPFSAARTYGFFSFSHLSVLRAQNAHNIPLLQNARQNDDSVRRAPSPRNQRDEDVD